MFLTVLRNSKCIRKRHNCLLRGAAPRESAPTKSFKKDSKRSDPKRSTYVTMSGDGICTYEECLKIIGTLTRLTPMPTFRNIRQLVRELIIAAKEIPSLQSDINGHAGMIMAPVLYAMIEHAPWTEPDNPGPRPAFPQHRVAGEQERLEIDQEWKVEHRIWCTYSNFRRACHHAINKAVPEEYKTTDTIGQSGYVSNMTIRQIIDTLEDPWGIPTPADIMSNDRLINQPWDGKNMVTLFKRFEDCQVVAIAAQTEYSVDQLMVHVLILIEHSRKYRDYTK